MHFLGKSVKLTAKYTNHSIRATVIGTLDDKGFEARHITAISSHRNESTVKTYSTKCPDKKKKEMYDALNQEIVPKRSSLPTATVNKTTAHPTFSTINQQAAAEIIDFNPNANQNNNNIALPEEFQLDTFDTEDDDFLLEYIKNTETPNATTTSTTVNTVNTMSTSMPIVPKMYFPNSMSMSR